MATYQAKVSGISSLLLHRWSEAKEVEEATRPIHVERRDPRTEAEAVCYRRRDGTIYVPGAQFARMLRDAGSAHKQRGSRKSLRYIVPAAIIVLADDITLLNGDGRAFTDFEIDSRPVVIPSTKGRIMRHRPRFNVPWSLEFSVEVDPTLIDADTALQLLTEGGRRLGIGDYRPSSGGPFGRFAVVSWEELAPGEVTAPVAKRGASRKRA